MNRRLTALAALIAVTVIVVVAWNRIKESLFGSTADCRLHPSASFVTRDAPISRSMNIPTDMLMLRNQDGDTWTDVEVTVVGYENIGTKGRQPSGAYVLPTTRLHNKGGLYAIQMNDFEKVSGGSRWVSLTMTPEVFTVKAKVNGKTCSVDVTPDLK